MIQMIQININPNLDILYSISDITTILTLIPLIIFLWLSIKSKSIKSFQFQIFVFILLYFVGQIMENNNNRIHIFSILSPNLGSQIHVIAAVFLTIVIWLRFYYSERRKKKMMDNPKDDII
jgi:hypothetical protein